MRVLVLGGTRFLGPFVVDELRSRGHEVGIVSHAEVACGGSVRSHRGDASDPAVLEPMLRSWRPEGLVDMLHHGPDHARAVAEVCGGKLSRSVHISCASVYGSAPVCPVDEETDLVSGEDVPKEVLAQIDADRVVIEASERGDLPGTVVRLPALYGPRSRDCAEWFFVKRVLDGRSRVALPDGGLHICHRGFAQNMAWGVVQALLSSRAGGQVYNIGEEKLYTLAQLATGIARALDHAWDLYSVPGHLWTAPYARTSFFDLRKARGHLRYKDRMIPRDGLELTAAWLCQSPPGNDWRWPGIAEAFDYAREDALIEEHGVRI